MSKPIVREITNRFPRVDREAPVLMFFVEKKQKRLGYDREELGPEFYGIINESFEEVINKVVDLFVLASQSPRGFKLIRERRKLNPEEFRKEMAKKYEFLDDLQRAYVDLDRFMILDFWRQKYGADICLVSAMSTIAAGAMLFIDKQIDKQLKPQKHVSWKEDLENENKKNEENEKVYWVNKIQNKQNHDEISEEKSDETNLLQNKNGSSQSK